MKLIPKDTINFLKELKLNNNRNWFNENKQRFNSIQSGVKEFANEVNESLKKSDDIEKLKIFSIQRFEVFERQNTLQEKYWYGISQS